MSKNLFLDCLREIKKSWGRYFSIMAIVCLGVGFFAGINAASPDMIITAEQYYRDTNLMDIRIVSTHGLTDDDLSAISNYSNVYQVEKAYSYDAIQVTDVETRVIRLHSVPDNINKVRLIEGRMPSNPYECVVENGDILPNEFVIGYEIELYRNNEDISDTLKTNTFKIVGIVESPYYISFEKGASQIGTGGVNTFIMVNKDAFTLDVYTEIYATLEITKDHVFTSSEYKSAIDSFVDGMDGFVAERETIRYENIVQQAQDELDDAKEEAFEEFDKAKKELDSAKRQLDSGQRELDKNKQEAQAGFQQAEETLAMLNEQLALIDMAQIDQSIQTVNGLRLHAQTLEQEIATLDGELQLLLAELETLIPASPEYIDVETRILDINTQISNKTTEIATTNATIQTIDTQLSGYYQLIGGIETCENVLKDRTAVETALKNAQAKLNSGYREYRSGINEYNTEYEKVMQEIEDAQNEINDIEKTEWFVFTRDDNVGYSEFEENASRIAAIATIFPAFFLLIAALVCLTAMTRMVDENRTQIGSYKALGYSNIQIASKYLIYSGSATLIGALIGLSIGFVAFPNLVFNAYKIIYRMPNAITPYHIDLAIQSIILAEIATMGAATLSCYKELSTVPASLLRPKTPKNGKRVLIERIGFIWKHFSFTLKVTTRNLFRYKKKMLMTVIGIAGCTSLMVAAFGIKDSISAIGDIQFNEINKQSLIVILDKNTDINEYDTSTGEYDIDEQLYVSAHSAKCNRENASDVEFNIVIPNDISEIGKFVTLRTLNEKTPLSIENNGVLISQKFASLTNTKVNDYITFETDNQEYTVKVSGIYENYLGHYMYMSSEYYEEITNKEPTINQTFVVSDGNLTDLSSDLMNDDAVIAVIKMADIGQDLDDMISALNVVIAALIVCAAALAFIVLFNLVNINITERIRELATIKVLGFRDNEVTSYLYRENAILTVLGIFVGFGIGIILHRFVITTVEIDTMLFGRTIHLPSYIYSAIFTLAFSIIVNIYTHFSLKKINMIESLKSVE